MKKYLALVVSVLFILSLSVVAFAQDKPEITLGGKIIVKGWYIKNLGFLENELNESNPYKIPTESDSQAFYHENINLTVDAKVTDNVRGFVEIETASGTSRNSGLWYWGNYDTKPDTELRIRQGWIQYTGSGLLGAPAGIKIGHMPISLGEKLFLNNERFGNDAILVWVDPTKEVHLAAGTTKLQEGAVLTSSASHTDDLDGYILLATYMLDKDNTIGVNWLWAHSDGVCPSFEVDPDLGYNVDKLNFNNIGIHANGNISGLKYAAEVDFQFGKVVFDTENVGDPLDLDRSEQKAKGWAVMAKLGYMIDPVNIRASFAMGSGDDDLSDEDCKEFKALMGPDYSPTARLVHYTQIYERTVSTAAIDAGLTTTLGGNNTNTGIANTTYYNIGFDINPVKELSISLDGFLLRATKVGAWEDLTGEDVSKSIGWEVDSKISYKIAKNLTYFVEAGLFKPGNFYRDTYLLADELDKKTVTQAIHGLSLEF